MLKATEVRALLIDIAEMFIAKKEELSDYDSVIGDGDHGFTMARGAEAAKLKMLEMDAASCRDYFKVYGRTLISTLGGAMGPLYGSVFLELSKACRGKTEVGLKEFAEGFVNAHQKVTDLGGAKPGDKTMVDAMVPAALALVDAEQNARSLLAGFDAAVLAANEGVQSTIPLIAKRGRSRYLQQKAIGHQDAGATSFSYLIHTIHQFIARREA
ncbi:dihydroxyacetone kinase subunit DhaL [Thaumasiovibrio subtropicus]|uniref:dihydroxyacetone kinase subunit DhaL n=1 Tax=Thaumasiovibrio subtropicus TaxID=1891207 RepID=UPI000B34F38A|nr:dihydroxyacetone kinase subunit DhaL [Thaumasiovibrio subtropicus]